MLKEISRSEAIERMTGDRPVYMIFELSGKITIDDLLSADGFAIDEPEPDLIDPTEALNVAMAQDHEPRKASPEPRKEELADPDPVPGTNKQRVPDAVFRELHAKGMTNKEIAKEIGYTEQTVHARLTKLGLKRNRE